MEREPSGLANARSPSPASTALSSTALVRDGSQAGTSSFQLMERTPTHRRSLPHPRPHPNRIPRRTSALQHELHPPSRRLSSHQLLLLTPFGGDLPAGVLGGSPDSCVRPASLSGPARPARTPPSVQPATLGSQPLATILSNSSSGSNDPIDLDHPLFYPTTAVVPMTRSNSLPIMTLNELEALRRRDEDHGIVRGGHWAWVSKEVEVIDETLETSPKSSVEAGTAFPAYAGPSSTFSNPFGSIFNENPFGGVHNPQSTAAGYHYDLGPHNSPKSAQTRRASEALSTDTASTVTSPPVAGSRELRNRRPSAPVVAAAPSALSSATQNYSQPSTQPSSRRPSLQRYKSSPGRSSGLGLNINVVGLASRSSPPRVDVRMSTPTKRSPRQREGSWASVAVLDGNLAMIDASSEENVSLRRASVIQLPIDQGSLLAMKGTFDLTMAEPEPHVRRSRFESVDSALPHFGDTRHKLALSRWVERLGTWPRRGSLAVEMGSRREFEASG